MFDAFTVCGWALGSGWEVVPLTLPLHFTAAAVDRTSIFKRLERVLTTAGISID